VTAAGRDRRGAPVRDRTPRPDARGRRGTDPGDAAGAAAAARPRAWAAFWPGALLALALLVPFLGKAHTIDDVTFLLQAQHCLQDPLHPTAFELVADGQRIRLSSALVSGPVMAYLLVPAALLGGAEWAAHLVQLLLLLAAVLATVALGLRLGLGRSEARFAGLLLAGTPAVAALATTAMADVPSMAFGVIGMERLLCWRDEGRWPQGIAAGLAFALAALARPQMLFLLALALLAAWGGRGIRVRSVARVALPSLIAAALFLLVTRLTADPQQPHGDIVQATLARVRLDALARKWAQFSAHWALALPLALPWIIARGRRMARDPVTWVVAIAGAAALFVAADPALPLALASLPLLGMMALADVLRDALRRGDRDQLLLGAWLLLALPTLGYFHVPAKYLVPSAPAVALLVARLLRRPEDRLARPVAWGVVAAGAVLGLLVVHADAEFADLGRRAARELIAPRVRAGQRVWYGGGWGFQWYAQQAGAAVLASAPPYPEPGDFIVTSDVTPGVKVNAAIADAVAGQPARSRWGRILSPADHAAFYVPELGVLPWTWRNGPIDVVRTWRVRGPEAASR
jgi:4-amino-4-deoxy-L-arabinose transferase-like glycosyltransferase